MALRKVRILDTVSLFPFLGVLACAIGVLTLVMSALAVGQIDEGSQSDEAQQRNAEYKEYKKLLQFIEKEENESARLNDRLAVIRDSESEQVERANQLEKLIADRDRAAAAVADRPELDAAQLALTSQISQAEADLAAKEQEFAAKEAELNDLRIPKFPPIRVQRSEFKQQTARKVTQLRLRFEEDRIFSKDEKKPQEPRVQPADVKFFFVECDADGVVILGSDGRERVAAADIANRDKAFFKEVERAAGLPRGGGCLVFLVRADGVATFSAAQALAKERRCLTGKVPVPTAGDIDISAIEVTD